MTHSHKRIWSHERLFYVEIWTTKIRILTGTRTCRIAIPYRPWTWRSPLASGFHWSFFSYCKEAGGLKAANSQMRAFKRLKVKMSIFDKEGFTFALNNQAYCESSRKRLGLERGCNGKLTVRAAESYLCLGHSYNQFTSLITHLQNIRCKKVWERATRYNFLNVHIKWKVYSCVLEGHMERWKFITNKGNWSTPYAGHIISGEVTSSNYRKGGWLVWTFWWC